MASDSANTELDIETLNAVCFSLAKDSKWEMRPVDVAEINMLADQLAEVAARHIDYLQGQQRDPNIVTRAVRYIAHHHGEPRSAPVSWFDAMLQTLVELACPNTQATSASELFYQDIEEGIRQSRADFD